MMGERDYRALSVTGVSHLAQPIRRIKKKRMKLRLRLVTIPADVETTSNSCRPYHRRLG